MVSLKKSFSNSYGDLKKRFSIYFILSFIIIVSLTLILIGNSSFLETIVVQGNTIYSDVVESTNTGSSLDISPPIVKIILSFLKWLFLLFVIISCTSSIVLSSLKSKIKKSNKFWIYSFISSLILGLLISWVLRPIYIQLFLFYSLFIFTIIYLVIFLKKDYSLFFKSFKLVWKKILILEISYYLIILFLLLVKVLFIKQLLYDSLKVLFNYVDLAILLFFIHILFHSVTSSKKRKLGIKYSVSTVKCYKISGIVVVFLLVSLVIISLLNLFPYTEVLVDLILYIEFSFGIVYLTSILAEVNK